RCGNWLMGRLSAFSPACHSKPLPFVMLSETKNLVRWIPIFSSAAQNDSNGRIVSLPLLR
ncbi:MAG TPA: hypothetical protein VEH81_04935, partial [Ktedonobacteraceae bacterium]|nr:hypothetical protein [Ktedonobacteraceae bacterium]